MTGFGVASATAEGMELTAEARSLNHRYLRINVHLPEVLTRYEPQVLQRIKSRVKRGTVDLSVRLELSVATGALFNLNKARIFWQELEKLKQEFNIKEEISLQSLLGLPGVVGSPEAAVEHEKVWTRVEGLVEEALEDMVEMREREGGSLLAELKKQLKRISSYIEKVRSLLPQALKAYEMRLRERLEALLAQIAEREVKFSEEEVLREVALLAERGDVSEELARLESHIGQFSLLLDKDCPVGRKLEFLAQEMHREAQTSTAKALSVEVLQPLLSIKAEVDKIKEQLMNVE
jgi:uncharacterized protein (TIGR00255 family)